MAQVGANQCVSVNRCVSFSQVAASVDRPAHPEGKKTKNKRLRCTADRAMGQSELAIEFNEQFNDVVTRLQSKQLFQSDWDIASFAVFFIFIGMVLLLVILVLIRCCCCCCCDDEKPRRRKVGIDNMAMEP
ncbi:Small integral membrane protein 22 [Larimichthys crocea]|uniref:Uncharacterized protein n=1 Tax=Larimichthys crocea TaxID=215358 RepID=A0ACD3R658_LARCR|nr:Small integral membrane protein 22 [Larimichthys crocea]